jgi:hypothetical protein
MGLYLQEVLKEEIDDVKNLFGGGVELIRLTRQELMLEYIRARMHARRGANQGFQSCATTWTLNPQPLPIIHRHRHRRSCLAFVGLPLNSTLLVVVKLS